MLFWKLFERERKHRLHSKQHRHVLKQHRLCIVIRSDRRSFGTSATLNPQSASDLFLPSFLAKKNRSGATLVWTVASGCARNAIKFWTRDLIAGNKVGAKPARPSVRTDRFPALRPLAVAPCLIWASCVMCEQSHPALLSNAS